MNADEVLEHYKLRSGERTKISLDSWEHPKHEYARVHSLFHSVMMVKNGDLMSQKLTPEQVNQTKTYFNNLLHTSYKSKNFFALSTEEQEDLFCKVDELHC